jgi:PAS domain S-box-containing protein
VVLVTLYCLLLFAQLIRNQTVRANQRAYEQRVSEARNLRTMLLDMETGTRGYLLTHDSTFLEPYQQSKLDLPDEMRAFSKVSQGDSSAENQCKKINGMIGTWLELAQVMASSQPSGPLDRKMLERDRVEFDDLRHELRMYINVSTDKVGQLEVEISDNRDQIKALALLGAIGLAGSLIVGVLVLSRRIAGIYHRTTIAYEGQTRRATEASNLYQLITDNSGDLISLIDSSGRYTFVSPSYERVLGYTKEDLLGKQVADFVDHKDGKSDTRWKRLSESGTGQELIRHRKADGQWTSIEVNARRFEEAFVAVGRDVSERVRFEEELRRLNGELEHRVEERTEELSIANKELEAFSYSVSHDLRAPLRSIASFSMILQQDVGANLDEESQDNLNRIRAAAAKMTELIDALLTFSRIVRADLIRSEVDLSQMAESVITELRRASNREVEVTLQPAMKDEADPHLIRLVLENLLENAWKFTSKTKNAKIEVGREGSVYFVRDNGVGFESQFGNKLFQPFERLHPEREYPGTGIGLATSKRIIDRHGGTIWAESEPGVQTTFHFTLHPTEGGN